jgi:hypothetical protein
MVLDATSYKDDYAPKRLTLDEFREGRKRQDRSRPFPGTGMEEAAVLRCIREGIATDTLYVEADGHDQGHIIKRYAVIAPDNPGRGVQLTADGQPYIKLTHIGVYFLSEQTVQQHRALAVLDASKQEQGVQNAKNEDVGPTITPIPLCCFDSATSTIPQAEAHPHFDSPALTKQGRRLSKSQSRTPILIDRSEKEPLEELEEKTKEKKAAGSFSQNSEVDEEPPAQDDYPQTPPLQATNSGNPTTEREASLTAASGQLGQINEPISNQAEMRHPASNEAEQHLTVLHAEWARLGQEIDDCLNYRRGGVLALIENRQILRRQIEALGGTPLEEEAVPLVSQATPSTLWDQVKELLKAKETNATYRSWVAPSYGRARHRNILIVEVGSAEQQRRLENLFAYHIDLKLREMRLQVRYELRAPDTAEPPHVIKESAPPLYIVRNDESA